MNVQTELTLPRSAKKLWFYRILNLSALVVSFGLGIVTGVSGTASYIERQKEKLFEDPEASIREQVDLFHDRVQLTEEQHAKADKIFRSRHAIVFKQLIETRDLISSELTQLENELSAIVEPDQLPAVHDFFLDVRHKALPANK